MRWRRDAFGGRNVDDAPLAAGLQVVEAGPNDALVRGEEHVERLEPLVLEGRVIELAPSDHAGVVDDDVDRAELGADLVDDPHDGVGVGHVEGGPEGGPADGLDPVDDRVDIGLPQVGDRHVCTLIGKQECGGPAHPRRRTRDEHDLAGDRAAATRQAIGHASRFALSVPAKSSRSSSLTPERLSS